MLEVMSFEVLAESVGKITRMLSWRQKIIFIRCDRESTEQNESMEAMSNVKY